MPEVTNVKRHPGIAGQFSVSAEIRYSEFDAVEDARPVTFYGNVAGGPVIMVTPSGQTFVTDPGRFGSSRGTAHRVGVPVLARTR